MRRIKQATAAFAAALVMSFGVSAAACTRPITEPAPERLRSAVTIVDDSVARRPRLLTRHPTPHEVAMYVTAVHKAQVHAAFGVWLAGLQHNALGAWLHGIERVSVRHTPAVVAPAPAPAPVVAAPTPVGSGETTIGEGVPCDGDLTPCWRVNMESRGTWNAYNPTGCYSNGKSGCYGPFQFGWFWAGKLGLPLDLATTTHAQWVAADRALWAGGAGCANWDACR